MVVGALGLGVAAVCGDKYFRDKELEEMGESPDDDGYIPDGDSSSEDNSPEGDAVTC